MPGDSIKTIVVFRRWKDSPSSVIALFPFEDEGAGRCSSFEHVGKHGAADYAGVIRRTLPAAPSQYAALKREPESAPYHYALDVRDHHNRNRGRRERGERIAA